MNTQKDQKNLSDLEALETNLSETKKVEKPNILDGYIKLSKHELPQHGELYPESWEFAYRCPTAKEVANFSTINEQDQPGIVVAVEELIRKCVIIFDTETETQISAGEICDGHRTFFLLKIRDYYLPGNPVRFGNVCQTCHEKRESSLDASKLIYPELTDKLIGAYDGRIFSLDMGLEAPVKFRVPTLETAGKIFRYIVKVYRGAEQDKKSDNIVYDKQFLLMAPYLFESGRETVKEITYKYKTIMKNEALFKAYLTIVNKLKLDNLEVFNDVCPNCGSEEEALIKFPGGWKNLFVADTDNTGYFD